MNETKKNFLTALGLYLLLAFLIMAPLYAPGFLFLLDMVWAPWFEWDDFTAHGLTSPLPLTLLLKTFSIIIPVSVLQKIVLTIALVLPGITMYFLARRYTEHLPALVSGLIYMLNPYVFERFMVGHWYVMLGYGLFPLVILLFLKFLDHPSRKTFVWFLMLFATYPIFSKHWAYIASGFLVVVGIVYLVRTKAYGLLLKKQTLAYAGITLITTLAVNSFWLFDFFERDKIINVISNSDFAAFATQPDAQFGILANVFSLYGLEYPLYILPKEVLPFWLVPMFLVVFFSLIGIYASLRGRLRNLPTVLAITFIPAMLLAIGYATPLTRTITDWLYAVMPLYGGLRETAKILGVIALTYALFAPIGAVFLTEKSLKYLSNGPKWTHTAMKSVLLGLVVLIPFWWAGTLFWGASGQVKSYPYPEDWFMVNQQLQTSENIGRVLVLPWQLYYRIDWAGGTLAANPSQIFFQHNLITSHVTDNVFLLERERNGFDVAFTRMIHGTETIDEHLDAFGAHRVTHIMLHKIDNWQEYGFVASSTNMVPVFEGDTILLYEINYPTE